MSNIYIFELKRLLGRVSTYVYLALMLVSQGFMIARVNLYGASPAVEYTAEILTLPLLLCLPILTFGTVAKDRLTGFDSVLRSLGISPIQTVIGKILSVYTVFALSTLPLAIMPLIISAMCKVNFISAYIGILGYLLFGLTLTCTGIFISSLCKKKLHSALFTYGASVLIYLAELINTLFYMNINASFLTLTAFAVCLSLAFMLVTHSEYIWLAVLASLEIIIIIFRFVFPSAIKQLAAAVLEMVGFRESLNGFCYGLFDISSLANLIILSALMTALTVMAVSFGKGAYETNGGEAV